LGRKNYYLKAQKVIDANGDLTKYLKNYGYNKKEIVCDFNGNCVE